MEIQTWCLGLRHKLGSCGDGRVSIKLLTHSFTHSFNNRIQMLTQSQALLITYFTVSQMIRKVVKFPLLYQALC